MIHSWYAVARGLVVALVLSSAAIACSDSTAVGGGGQLTIVHSPDTAGAPGWRLRDTLVVRLADSDGAPLPDAQIQWTVRLGGGTVTPLADSTDAAGEAAALWTLGGLGSNRLRASTPDGDSVTFEVNASVFRADVFDSDYKLGCGLKAGAIWCWGNTAGVDDSPSLGPPLALFGDAGGTTMLADDSRQYVAVAVHGDSYCALDVTGSLSCGIWDFDFDAPEVFSIAHPTGLPALSSIISSDDWSADKMYCGLAVADSTAWCTGAQGSGTAVPGSPALASLVAGDGWFCGLRGDSTAVCWGDGPLGDGVTQSSATPIEVAGDHRFVKLRSEATFACGLSDAGEVYCWASGETPVLIAEGADDVAVDLGIVMVRQGSTVKEFPGRGPSGESALIEPLTGLDNLSVARLGTGSISCVGLVDGELYCWNELWVNSTAILTSDYSPVQPPPSN